MFVLSVVSVTLNQKRPKSLWRMEKKCFTFIIVFYIEHISVQLVLINVYTYDGLCVSFESKIPILRRNNIVLTVKFHFAGELRGFVPLCVFLDLCVEFWEYEAHFQKMCVNNWEKL